MQVAATMARSVDGCLHAVKEAISLVGAQHSQHAAERQQDREMMQSMLSTCLRQSGTMINQYQVDRHRLKQEMDKWRGYENEQEYDARVSSSGTTVRLTARDDAAKRRSSQQQGDAE